MSMKMAIALLAFLALGPGAAAEEDAEEPSQEKAEKPRKPETPLRLQVVFSRYQGEKKITSFPYTLPVNAEGRPAKLRMGINVPLKYESKDYSGNVIFKSVGNNVDCSAESLDGGRYKLSCSVEQSSLYATEVERAVNPPVLRIFSSEAVLILKDGQSALYTSATDPINGETLKVDMTLSVVK